jgi:signal transduction histidine kinase
MAISLERVMHDFYSIWLKITLIFSIMSTIGFLIALRMSRRMEEDVITLTDYLEDVANKTYNKPLKLYFSYEFINIAGTLKQVVAKLDRRDRQRRRSAAKLKLMYKQQNDLLSAIGHEFKNPLAAISGYAQTLKEEKVDPKNEKIFHKFLAKIETNSEKISTMLDRLALSVKLENNDLTARKEHFDLGETVKDAIATIEKKYPDRAIKYKPKSRDVYMDKTMIEMVIVNLLDNAMKYSSEDITIKIGKKRLLVKDKGIGISESDLENIQRKFYRVDKNSWDNSMGLGLAIVNYILNLHDRRLEVKSKPNIGSTFSFEIDDPQL